MISQVAEQQVLLQRCLDERTRLELQVEGLERDRDALRASQRDARGDLRAMETQFKTQEAAAGACVEKRQALERQIVQLRGETNGLSTDQARRPPRNENMIIGSVAITSQRCPNSKKYKHVKTMIMTNTVELKSMEFLTNGLYCFETFGAWHG